MSDGAQPGQRLAILFGHDPALHEQHHAQDGGPLGEIAKAYPDVMIGSYPFQDDGRPNTNVVVRSRDPAKLAAAKAAVEDMLARVRAGLRQTA